MCPTKVCWLEIELYFYVICYMAKTLSQLNLLLI